MDLGQLHQPVRSQRHTAVLGPEPVTRACQWFRKWRAEMAECGDSHLIFIGAADHIEIEINTAFVYHCQACSNSHLWGWVGETKVETVVV